MHMHVEASLFFIWAKLCGNLIDERKFLASHFPVLSILYISKHILKFKPNLFYFVYLYYTSIEPNFITLSLFQLLLV